MEPACRLGSVSHAVDTGERALGSPSCGERTSLRTIRAAALPQARFLVIPRSRRGSQVLRARSDTWNVAVAWPVFNQQHPTIRGQMVDQLSVGGRGGTTLPLSRRKDLGGRGSGGLEPAGVVPPLDARPLPRRRETNDRPEFKGIRNPRSRNPPRSSPAAYIELSLVSQSARRLHLWRPLITRQGGRTVSGNWFAPGEIQPGLKKSSFECSMDEVWRWAR